MNPGILFRKKSAMSSWGLPWLNGGEEHAYCAVRNTTGKATASATLVRALLACLRGAVREAAVADLKINGHSIDEPGLWAVVESHSRPGTVAGRPARRS